MQNPTDRLHPISYDYIQDVVYIHGKDFNSLIIIAYKLDGHRTQHIGSPVLPTTTSDVQQFKPGLYL